jgi:hypothetical protein
LVKFKKPIVPDDTQFIETLVFVLDQARRGKIKGYSMVYIVDDPVVGHRTIEAAKAFEEYDNLMVLGAMRKMERNYMCRTWPEDHMTDKG